MSDTLPYPIKRYLCRPCEQTEAQHMCVVRAFETAGWTARIMDEIPARSTTAWKLW